jgi:hypothetical protein
MTSFTDLVDRESIMSNKSPDWETAVLRDIELFARQHGCTYRKTERQLSAYFEIGCFLQLIRFYELNGYDAFVENLGPTGEFRYLTNPGGSPHNFSYMTFRREAEVVELRQQLRVQSHLGRDICFAPDMTVIQSGTEIPRASDRDYARGARGFFSVPSSSVIASHECKSLVPFPELLVSFLGMFIAGHSWADARDHWPEQDVSGHFAPCLFVGGSASGLHLRMIQGLREAFPINIVVGMHADGLNVESKRQELRVMRNPLFR